LQPLLGSPAVGGAAPHKWVVVVGRGQVPRRIPPVAVVVVETSCMVGVVVMVMMICSLMMCQTALDPGQLLKTMSNREHGLLLSRLLLY